MSSEGDEHGSENNNRWDHDEGIKQLIPHDIVVCVLLRLPANSIGRFRSVCRQWRSLTHDDRFIDEHRGLGGASGRHIIVPSYQVSEKKMITRLSIYQVRPNCDEIKHRFVHIKFDIYTISNPANGLIGCFGTWDIFLLNPITREISQLPIHCNLVRPCGLGFDASTGAYKLVRFDSVRHTAGYSSLTVLTVGVGSWRHVCDVPLVVQPRPVFLHGTLHWLADTPAGRCILAFDVEHETLRSIPAPEVSTSDPKWKTRMSLRDFEGRVCIVDVFKFVPKWKSILEEAMSARIWMLADHEWKQLYQIDVPPLLKQFGDVKVVDIRGGQVLMQTQDTVYSCDLHGKNLRTVCCGGFPHEMGVITESLVSIGMEST